MVDKKQLLNSIWHFIKCPMADIFSVRLDDIDDSAFQKFIDFLFGSLVLPLVPLLLFIIIGTINNFVNELIWYIIDSAGMDLVIFVIFTFFYLVIGLLCLTYVYNYSKRPFVVLGFVLSFIPFAGFILEAAYSF